MIRGTAETIHVYRAYDGWRYTVTHTNGFDCGLAESEEAARQKAERIVDIHRSRPLQMIPA